VTRALKLPFASLAVPNYRRYFTGQVISISGNWMQVVAEMWLVLHLTGSGAALGLTAALQFTPLLLVGAWGGLLADRLSKRTLLTVTQTLMAVPALTLWALTASGSVRAWMVYALVFARGAVNAVDNPARQSFAMELVGRERLVNAVSLNSLIIHSSRIIGPALAGVVIASVGLAPCFLLNALSFGAMLIALRMIEPERLERTAPTPRRRGQVRSALKYVAATPELRVPLAVMALVGTLSFNFQVILPLMARFAFHGDAATYAALTAAMATGAVAGALAAGSRRRVTPRLLAAAALAFGVLSLAAAGAPTLAVELIVLAGTGAASVTFAAGVNSSLQLAVAPEMRGRVMALYSIVFLGSTPIGGPLAGWLAGAAGPRSSLVLAGIAALLGAVAMRALQPKHAADRLEPLDEAFDVGHRVVDGKRGTRRRRDAESAHQRLRAVVTGSHADAVPPQDLADVVGVSALEGEGHKRAPVFRRRRSVDHQPGHRREALERPADQGQLMGTNRVGAKRLDPIDGGPEPDRLGDL
jgi:MFS family permease